MHPADSEARWCLDQYYSELSERFTEGFDPSRSLAPDPSAFLRPNGVFLLASLGQRVVGCGAVKLTSADVGYVKRMWVSAGHRGAGFGRALLGALESAAIDLGAVVVQLETNRALTGAIRLYRASGYLEVAPFNDEIYAHHWFEKRLADASPVSDS